MCEKTTVHRFGAIKAILFNQQDMLNAFISTIHKSPSNILKKIT